MLKLKKYLLTLAGTLTAIAPIAVAVSCGNNATDYIPKNSRVAVIKENPGMTKEVAEKHKNQKLVYITDSGRVKDKSFNQSSWEALNLIDDQTQAGIDYKSYQSDGKYEEAYTNVLNDGRNVWILSGFGHGAPITKFILGNVDKMKDIKIIIVDTNVDEAALKGNDKALNYVKNNVYSAEFLTQQAAYVVGYATSQFLAEKHPTDESKRRISMFGGGAEPGVTNFITGYLRGMLAWNQANADKKVKTNSRNIRLDSGFVIDDKMNQVVLDVLADNPSMVMAVAGPGTTKVIEHLNNDPSKYSSVSVVGVDVDQSASDKDNKTRYATSITKNLGQAVYDLVLKIAYGVGVKEGEEIKHSQVEGLIQNWVGYAGSQLSGDDKAKMNDNLSKAKEKYNALDDEAKKLIISKKVNNSDTTDLAEGALVEALAKAVNA